MNEIIKENNTMNEQKEESSQQEYYTKLIGSKKFNNIKNKKQELNDSLSINKNNKISSLDNNEENQNKDSYNINNSFQSNKELILPRIPSADSRKNNNIIEYKKKIRKKNFSSSQKKNKNKYLPPKPNIQYNSEFIKLKKENEYMITELERLNIELRNLIDKQIPHIKIKKRYKTEGKRLDINRENEKKANRKYLHTLITEYNRIYKNLTIGQDIKSINNLEEELNLLKKSYNEDKHTNKVLKEQIYKTEQNLENYKKKRNYQIINLNDSENKYILYKNKLKELEKENERMNKLFLDEEQKIEQLKESYSKLEEILTYYEETKESIKKKNDEEIKNRELNLKLHKLIKKKEILEHARLTMEKSYGNKIEKQKKYINDLNLTLNELNKEIKMSE
jgi:hypothetical protein